MNLKPTETINVALAFGEKEVKVGRLAQKKNQIWFEYDGAFRASTLEISPIQLPLNSGVVTAKYQPFEGLHGVFNDSLPDGWGKLLLDRALTMRGISYQSLGPLDRLGYVGRNGMGALVYYPETSEEAPKNDFLDLNALADEMASVLEGESSAILEELYRMGGSSAGARPKIVAGFDAAENKIIHGRQILPDGYEHWLIKFPSSSDQPDIALVEFAYSQMAKAAGLEMADTRLFQGNKGRMYFGTQRFDRARSKRIHMHTASGLLQADHRIPNLDYAILMNCVLKLNNDIREVEKLFRLAAFNVFAHNRDDHGKNFSFLMNESGHWKLAPAYDLTFSYGPGRQHSTTILREGASPNIKHLLALGEMFGLKDRKEVIEQVREVVSNWGQYAEEAGVTKASSTMVAKALATI